MSRRCTKELRDTKAELTVSESEKQAMRNQYEKSLDRRETEKKQLEFQVTLCFQVIPAISSASLPFHFLFPAPFSQRDKRVRRFKAKSIEIGRLKREKKASIVINGDEENKLHS